MKMLRSVFGLAVVLGMLTVAFGDTPRHLGRAAVNGILVRLDGRDLIVRVKEATGEAKEITLPTDDNTEFRVDGEAGTIDDLRPEMMVQIISAVRNVPGPVRMVRATSKQLNGVVIRVEGRNLIVNTQGKDGLEVSVETDGRTQFYFAEAGAAAQNSQPSACRLEDMKAGMRVKVTPDTGVARKILVTGAAKKTAK